MTPVWAHEGRDIMSRVRSWLYLENGTWYYARTRLTMRGWQATIVSVPVPEGGESYDRAIHRMTNGRQGERYDYTGSAATEFQAKHRIDEWLARAVTEAERDAEPQGPLEINEGGECLNCGQSAGGTRE